MVLDLLHLATLREKLVEMAAPPSGVFAVPEPAHGCPVEHRLNAATQPGSGFGLDFPYRLDRLDDEVDIDRVNRQFTEHRIGVGFEGCRPLCGVLGVLPAIVMRGDVALGALAEGQGLGGFEGGLAPGGFAFLDRVDAVEPQPPTGKSALPRLFQPKCRDWPQPHLAQLAGSPEPEDPRFRAAFGDA